MSEYMYAKPFGQQQLFLLSYPGKICIDQLLFEDNCCKYHSDLEAIFDTDGIRALLKVCPVALVHFNTSKVFSERLTHATNGVSLSMEVVVEGEPCINIKKTEAEPKKSTIVCRISTCPHFQEFMEQLLAIVPSALCWTPYQLETTTLFLAELQQLENSTLILKNWINTSNKAAKESLLEKNLQLLVEYYLLFGAIYTVQ